MKERLHWFMPEEYDSDKWIVIPNAHIAGFISKRKEQIDYR